MLDELVTRRLMMHITYVYKRLFAAWQAGEVATAQRWQFLADRVILALRPFGVIAATKAALGFLGIACGGPRSPLTPLDDAHLDALRVALQEAGYFAMTQEAAV